MTTTTGHNIGKLYFDLGLGSEKQALEIQERLSNYSKNEISDILEKSFNNVVPDDSIAVINRLEIDLGEIPFVNFNEEFLDLFKSSLNKKLSGIQFDTLQDKENVRLYNKSQSDAEILKTFLLSGKVPWYQEGIKIDLQAIFEELIESKNPDNIIAFIRDNISNSDFMNRLVYQFPEGIVNKLIETIYHIRIHPYLKFIKQLFAILKRASIPAIRIAATIDLLRIILIEVIIESGEKVAINFEENFLMKLAGKISVEFKDILGQLQVAGPVADREVALKIRKLHKKSGLILKKEPELSKKEISGKEENILLRKDDDDVSSISYISNAGLVLLHPFLPELFKKLNYIKGNKFTGEPAILKAIHLLQYIASGNQPHPEYLLVLNKILCGYPTEKPVPLKISLNRQEKAAATRMVNAAIKHWPVLKNTSAKAFRNNLLQRQGILKQEEKGWKLLVERKSYDVLLDRIPWSYNIVKLAWMKNLIETEW